MPYPPRYLEFVRLFNEKKFFEAHEILEAEWRETSGPLREFYQGLIQIAAAWVHRQKHNPIGAQNLFDKAGRHLAGYERKILGLDWPALLEASKRAGAFGESPRIVLEQKS